MNKDCIFCQIVAGSISCYKIYEDQKFLAFLDRFPLTPGHTLVIPKKHFQWVWDIENPGEYFQAISKIARHYKQILKTELIASFTWGLGVPHAHYHILPDSPQLQKWFNYANQMQHEPQSSSDLDLQSWRNKLKMI